MTEERPWDKPKADAKPKTPLTNSQIVSWTVLVIVILAGVGWCSVATKSNMDQADQDGSAYGAKSACRDFVKARLKSPGSANFSSETPTMDVSGSWTVTGIVDSENSFGASVRNGYRCSTSTTGDDNWTVDSVQLDGN